MSGGCRDEAIEDFTTQPECFIFLATPAVGGFGLNLQVANKVLMMDPWWNVYQEKQAFFRVYRTGQTRPCHLMRLYTKGSVEDNMQKKQMTKQTEIDGVL
jgi:DNA repair protein RAD16